MTNVMTMMWMKDPKAISISKELSDSWKTKEVQIDAFGGMMDVGTIKYYGSIGGLMTPIGSSGQEQQQQQQPPADWMVSLREAEAFTMPTPLSHDTSAEPGNEMAEAEEQSSWSIWNWLS